MIYNALILPHFDYCSLVWSNCSETLKLKIYKNSKTGRQGLSQVIIMMFDQNKYYLSYAGKHWMKGDKISWKNV
jgi:hypothetical protein